MCILIRVLAFGGKPTKCTSPSHFATISPHSNTSRALGLLVPRAPDIDNDTEMVIRVEIPVVVRL